MHVRRLLPALVGAGLLTVAACGGTSGTTTVSSPATSGAAVSTTASTPTSGASASTSSSAAGSATETGTMSGGSSAATGAAVALPADCTPDQLATRVPGTFTFATDEPAYEPWVVNNDPASGDGFESAVAYAAAEKLGYTRDQVAWTRVAFNQALAGTGESFDADVNQFTITPERAQVVDFSSGYYDLTQTVITVAGSPISGATTIDALKGARLGGQIGTTSLTAINEQIVPTEAPAVFDTNELAAQALQNGQIDGLVVDPPTAFYLTAAQLTDGQIVGQLPPAAQPEQLGMLLAKDSPLTTCVSAAVDALRSEGTLDALADEWLPTRTVTELS
ncbi:amino acid ABC transporter substrate-binding protein [Nakamurella flavida]|uniref:Amino acid ABC transporter substrate-binding protein n=1 Tax=Nakamurella flavida TaxID=363630 RepID=A0A939C733_9ACTN|nr:ABC transporter substrate-binding protein [Nakamurella flavida]MBM9477752.1 amino acid ABC transporter substrate-binding protein [Nakamurella flavida]MDP9779304.1 polar amino acid transport system substrate-binding protein [Nakamurella flavida]